VDDHDDITANFHGGDEFSADANEHARATKARDRGRIRSLIFDRDDYGQGRGATCEECEDALSLSHQTCSARISELRALAVIHTINGEYRLTRRGVRARVHRIRRATV
jgi:hypothetical protein